MALVGRLRWSFIHMKLIVDKCSQGNNLQRKIKDSLTHLKMSSSTFGHLCSSQCSDLVLMRLGVLDSLEADGHDGDGWR